MKVEPKATAAQALEMMESDLYDVQRWGAVLVALGQSHEAVEVGGLYVIGNALCGIGTRLNEAFESAHAQFEKAPQ